MLPHYREVNFEEYDLTPCVNHVSVGIAINLFVLGITAFLSRVVFGAQTNTLQLPGFRAISLRSSIQQVFQNALASGENAVNEIDASALESLEAINQRLDQLGVAFHLSEVKGPVMDSCNGRTS